MAQLPFAVIPLDLGTVTTGNERAEKPAINLDNHYMGMKWGSNGASSIFVRGNFGGAKTVDFISLLSANAGAGTMIRVRLGSSQAEVDGVASYDSGALPFVPLAWAGDDEPTLSLDFTSQVYQVRTVDDKPRHSHLELDAPIGATWWRIDITGHVGDFEASRLIIGKKLTPTRFYDRDFERGVEDLGSLEISRMGVLHVTPGVKLRRLKFKLAWVTEAEQEEMFGPMVEELGSTGLSYWCFDPEPTAYRQRRTYYGWFRESPYATGGAKPKTFQKDFDITSLI